MSKINFLKPDKSNLQIFLYSGTFLFFISILDVFLNAFFRVNLTFFLPGFLSFLLPLILGFIGLYFIRIELSGVKKLDLINSLNNKTMIQKQQDGDSKPSPKKYGGSHKKRKK